MNTIIKLLSYSILVLVAFLFFLYLTFPYTVLKENLALRLSESSSSPVVIGQMQPSFPLGVSVNDLVVGYPSDEFKIKDINVSISVLYLLLGTVKTSLFLHDEKKGSLNLAIKFSLFDLIKGSFVPFGVWVESVNFDVGSLTNYILARLQDKFVKNKDYVLFAPLLEKISVVGRTNINIDINIDKEYFNQTYGEIDVKFINSQFVFEPSMNLPSQIFQSAFFKIKIGDGKFSFSKSSGVKSPDLDLNIWGGGKLGVDIKKTTYDISVNTKFLGQLKEKFSFILSTFSGFRNGQMKLNLKGDFDNKFKLKYN
jgi:type II secretion system protein N